MQARAPNSPVLIVGTHYDLVKEKFPPSWSEDLQQMIRDKFINVIDADKLGLPRVLDTIEVKRQEQVMLCYWDRTVMIVLLICFILFLIDKIITCISLVSFVIFFLGELQDEAQCQTSVQLDI